MGRCALSASTVDCAFGSSSDSLRTYFELHARFPWRRPVDVLTAHADGLRRGVAARADEGEFGRAFRLWWRRWRLLRRRVSGRERHAPGRSDKERPEGLPIGFDH